MKVNYDQKYPMPHKPSSGVLINKPTSGLHNGDTVEARLKVARQVYGVQTSTERKTGHLSHEQSQPRARQRMDLKTNASAGEMPPSTNTKLSNNISQERTAPSKTSVSNIPITYWLFIIWQWCNRDSMWAIWCIKFHKMYVWVCMHVCMRVCANTAKPIHL